MGPDAGGNALCTCACHYGEFYIWGSGAGNNKLWSTFVCGVIGIARHIRLEGKCEQATSRLSRPWLPGDSKPGGAGGAKTITKFSPEVRERAVRLVLEHQAGYPSQ